MAKKQLTTQQQLELVNANPILWLKNMTKIVDIEGNLIPFDLNPEQKDFVKGMDRYNVILKSRQLGFSTLTLGLMLHSAFTNNYSNYLLLCHDTESTQNLFTKLKAMYDSIPDKFRIPFRKSNETELYLENGSRISVKIASRQKQLGRSFTCRIIHLSEYAFWSDEVQKSGLLALEQALDKNENARLIIESTANGINNFYNLFMQANKGHSKYKAFFYPWFSEGAKKQFKTEIDMAMQWAKSKGSHYIKKGNDLTPDELKLRDMGANLRQLTWREWKLQDLKEQEFHQEYPSWPEQAFISTNESVFDTYVIEERYAYLPIPFTVNELDLPDTLTRYVGKALHIYEKPKVSNNYFGGVDTSAGLSKNSDYSATCILNSNGEQVAVFYASGIPVYKYAQIVYDLGIYFNYAMFMIERNSYGLDLIQRLRRDMGYLQILKTFRWDKITGRKTYEYGWHTDAVNKAKMVSDLKETFEEGIILINDQETLDEMKVYAEKDGRFSNIRREGYYDDCVDALGFAVQSMKANKSYL